MNLYTQGFLHLGFSLAARLLSPIERYLTNLPLLGPNQRVALRYAPITGLLTAEPWLVAENDSPFPYGLDVVGPVRV